MTDEERVLKNIKYIIKQNYVDTEDDIIGILISASNLIKKQSKEIEELKQNRDEYKEEYIKLQNARYYNYISKDKIKAKIEELNKDFKEYENGQEWEIQDEIRGQIDVLQSLLEKE